MKTGKRIMKKTAGIATKLLFVTVFTKAVKRGIIMGVRKMRSVIKGATKNAK